MIVDYRVGGAPGAPKSAVDNRKLTGSPGSYPYSHGRHLLIVIGLFSYADESGIDPAVSPYCVVAGYIASPTQWEAYRATWTDVLKRHGIVRFHAQRFFSRDERRQRVGEYRAWPDERARQYIGELCGVILSSGLRAAGCAVNIQDFKSLSYGERRVLSGGMLSREGRWRSSGAATKPYYVAFLKFLAEAAEVVGEDTLVSFVFDRQAVLAARAVATFEETVQHSQLAVARRLHDVRYAASDQVPELQAADLLTHLWYSCLTRGDAMGDERDYAMTLVTAGPGRVGVDNLSSMEDSLSRLPPDLRTRLKASKPGERSLPKLP